MELTGCMDVLVVVMRSTSQTWERHPYLPSPEPVWEAFWHHTGPNAFGFEREDAMLALTLKVTCVDDLPNPEVPLPFPFVNEP